jgi:hypothetical protein
MIIRNTSIQKHTIKKPMNPNDYGLFLNWLIKHYSTATVDGLFCYVNSQDKEVMIKDIVNEYLVKIHANK